MAGSRAAGQPRKMDGPEIGDLRWLHPTFLQLFPPVASRPSLLQGACSGWSTAVVTAPGCLDCLGCRWAAKEQSAPHWMPSDWLIRGGRTIAGQRAELCVVIASHPIRRNFCSPHPHPHPIPSYLGLAWASYLGASPLPPVLPSNLSINTTTPSARMGSRCLSKSQSPSSDLERDPRHPSDWPDESGSANGQHVTHTVAPSRHVSPAAALSWPGDDQPSNPVGRHRINDGLEAGESTVAIRCPPCPPSLPVLARVRRGHVPLPPLQSAPAFWLQRHGTARHDTRDNPPSQCSPTPPHVTTHTCQKPRRQFNTYTYISQSTCQFHRSNLARYLGSHHIHNP